MHVEVRVPRMGVRRSLRERGATAAEYAIMASLIAGVIFLAVTAVGLATNGLFESVVNNWPKT